MKCVGAGPGRSTRPRHGTRVQPEADGTPGSFQRPFPARVGAAPRPFRCLPGGRTAGAPFPSPRDDGRPSGLFTPASSLHGRGPHLCPPHLMGRGTRSAQSRTARGRAAPHSRRPRPRPRPAPTGGVRERERGRWGSASTRRRRASGQVPRGTTPCGQGRAEVREEGPARESETERGGDGGSGPRVARKRERT